jgi:Protein of unknown function (DUF664)
MERVYAVWAVGGGELVLSYCTEEEPDGDIVGLSAAQVTDSLAAWRRERSAAEALIASTDLDAVGAGNRRTVRWSLVKLLQEYARHNGHADLLRERTDGATGE